MQFRIHITFPTLIFIFFFNGSLAASKNSIFYHPLSAKNEVAFMKVQNAQAKIDNVYGDFTQTRYMKLLSKPLISSGVFHLSKTDGLQWLQQKPFKSILMITEDKIQQSIEGKQAMVITKKEQPIVFSFTHIFLSIFKGNTEALKQYFDIYFIECNNNWHLGLKPIDSPLNKAIDSIEIIGEKYVTRILVNEAQGNHMLIQFSNISDKQK
ncbi:outer membrane lipoprotein carrier protein LolA [Fastidiosibacter lacustris]|uniref:outer membrane lipoprotein carrier protein LolA n=1 Tax=Fastidiosibacter lacustris TaxID=2056695 RepID=UPI000E354DE2|nr:outer membrane lipoprotein carrier protein LolA [Fastidiosibacter lacustris]